MANPFVHVVLQTQDKNKASEFYGALFNWKLEEVPMQGSDTSYTMINVGEGVGGGMMQHPTPDAPSQWIPYMTVDNVENKTSNAQSLGATILRDKTEVPEHGWFSILQDPSGAVFGLWQDKK